MKLSKNELLEILIEVIKHDYSLEKLSTILEIIDVYEPTYCSIWKPSEEILIASEEEEEESDSDESSVAVYLTEGEDSE